MKRLALCLTMLSALVVPGLVGCDETVYEERKVEEKRDGTVVTEKEKVTESPDGDVKKTEEKTVDR